ncbi:MAG: hypothetical protein U1A77_10745 [Pirellulales bacterium]
MASSHGNDTATPNPRNTVRREIFLAGNMVEWTLYLDNFSLDDFVDSPAVEFV